jgi:hypothetical protein
MIDNDQGKNTRRRRTQAKAAALAWLTGAAVVCLIAWALVLKAAIE